MRIPFERLVGQVAALGAADQDLPMGVMAGRFGVSTERLADAVDALKMLHAGRSVLIVPEGPAAAFFDAHDLATIGMYDDDDDRPAEPPPPDPVLDAIVGIEQYTDDILSGERRFVVWDGRLWRRYYREGGYDGYQTWLPPHRRLPCATMETAVRRPDMADQIRRLSRTGYSRHS